MLDIAQEYLQTGLCVLPARLVEKRPSLPRWNEYQLRLPTERHIDAWFSDTGSVDAMCIVAGAVSGNLEILDFDLQGELFEPWRAGVEATSPGLFERLVIERSQSGGRHVLYRCECTVDSNQKLAQRVMVADSADPITIHGKTFVPRRVADRYEVTLTLIETRGEGGLVLCAPSPGYEVVQGSLSAIPVLRAAERAVLLQEARALNEVLPPAVSEPTESADSGRPGDDYNRRGDIGELLRHHGWQLVRGGENQYWRRPGKDAGQSATLRDRVFYVFSSNAPPFEAETSYRPFSMYALLEHEGDYAAAAAELRQQGYGQSACPVVDLSGILRIHSVCPAPADLYPDPGPLPPELLHVPGFVAEVMEYCLATAPYPNRVMAFCGAVALQATLAGRKVRDADDNRTNLYLLALAPSAAGKDWPRKLNTAILHQIGALSVLGERFASGEGIQDALLANPTMLFQTDEIDGLLQVINKAGDNRYESIMGTLLTIFSSANTFYPMRRKAGKEAAQVIDQPCLVLFGTAIPQHYYAALSERMLTNGFFARMLVIESGPRSQGQNARIIEPPEPILEVARWWMAFNPSGGNLSQCHPEPLVVPATPEAQEMLTAIRDETDREYGRAEAQADCVGTAVWGRVNEYIRKLALIYAVSACHDAPEIHAAAVRWAQQFAMYHTRRMLFMAHTHVADNPFHGHCIKLLNKLREAPDRELSHSVLLKRMKMDAKSFRELIFTLEQQGDLLSLTQTIGGRKQMTYRLTEGGLPG